MRSLALAAALVLFAAPAHASTALDLVHIAQQYEASHQEDIALRRYMDALALDPACADAYLGLGSLRARRGDLREAERVYDVALEHLPQLREARTARAQIRRAMGATSEAIDDLLLGAENDVAALRTVANWHAADGHTPAQLATWRRILVVAEVMQATALIKEARTMVRALVIVVGPADPAAAPTGAGAIRSFLSPLARRGGT